MKRDMMLKRLTTLCGLGIIFLSDSCLWAQEKLNFETFLYKVGKHNIEYLSKSMDVQIKDAEVIAAKALPDPSLDIEMSHDSYSLGVSYTVQLGKRRAHVELAESERNMEQLLFEARFQDLRFKAAELFLDAMLQRELLAAKEKAYSFMNELNRSDSIRLIKGEITENDARQTRLEAISLLNEVYDQEAVFHSSLVELNRFMGVDSDILSIPVGSFENLERNFRLPLLLDEGRANRPEILIASKNIELLQQNYKVVRADRRPDIGLSLSYERDWNHFLPQARQATLGISIPLMFSRVNKGVIMSAKLKREQSQIEYRDIELQVLSEIRQSWFEFEAEQKKIGQFRKGIMEQSRKILDGMVYKYRRGESTVLDVLISQRTYNEVCQDYLKTMKSYVFSLVSLERACGIWDIRF